MIDSQPATEGVLGTPEITPLIDIVFIVIVFLLVTANTPLLSMPVSVPSADQDVILSGEKTKKLVVTISPTKPYWHIDKESYQSWLDFKGALLKEIRSSEKSITIAADKAAPTEPLLKLLSLLNQQSITNATIIMNTPSEML